MTFYVTINLNFLKKWG